MRRGRGCVLHAGDLSDAGSVVRVVGESAPDEVYNLGAQSHVQRGFEMPVYTADVNALGALRVFEALRALRRAGEVRVYQASTSEIFGNALTDRSLQVCSTSVRST